jgi:hypothetical protein
LGEISHRANKKGRTKEFLGEKYTKVAIKNPDTSGGRQNIAGFLRNSNLLSDM